MADWKKMTRRIGLLAGLALAALIPGRVAMAAGAFHAPKGCTGFLTVQMRGCLVSNHYHCKGDAKGDQLRVDFDDQGPFFATRTNAETEWLETYDLSSGTYEVLEPHGKAPASFSRLLKTGADRYDFVMKADDGGIEHVTGYDKLTGVKRSVSGVTLEQTDYVTQSVDAKGKLLWKSQGHEWISREFGLFFAGTGLWQDDQGKTKFDNTPALLLKPGQQGFMSTTPEFDCNTVLSQLSLPTPKDEVIQ